MNINLVEALNNFRGITIELINCVEKEQYDSLDELFDDRQKLIEGMKILNYEFKEFSEVCSKYEIGNLEKRLSDLMADKQAELKIKMNNVAQGKSAVKHYNKRQYIDSIFFTKKI